MIRGLARPTTVRARAWPRARPPAWAPAWAQAWPPAWPPARRLATAGAGDSTSKPAGAAPGGAAPGGGSSGPSGSHKLAFSYEERNARLAERGVGDVYPLLGSVRHDLGGEPLPIGDVLERWAGVAHTPGPPETQLVQTCGRITAVRRSSRGLLFVDLEHQGRSLQAVVNEAKAGRPFAAREHETHALLRRGDAVAVAGRPWRTRAGQLSVLAAEPLVLLAPCLHPLPEPAVGAAVRQHNRVAELKAFALPRRRLQVRALVMQRVRAFLAGRGFLEVQTPVLAAERGGATAEPFVTKDGLALRIAPELWLKRLVIGGLDRVFELGPSFRNEGVDATHNPEFTTCEFYMAYATLDELAALTEALIVETAQAVAATFPEFEAHAAPLATATWRRVDFVGEIERAAGRRLPEDLADVDALRAYVLAAGLPADGAPAKLLDRLAAHFIEPHCDGPTLLLNQPSLMAPLAKQTTVEINGVPRVVSRRFELLIGGREYVNAYEEENAPSEQRRKLLIDAPPGSDPADQAYIDAMEWGLPPTGGWGLGVDRLVMLLTGAPRIHDVLAFGSIRSVQAN